MTKRTRTSRPPKNATRAHSRKNHASAGVERGDALWGATPRAKPQLKIPQLTLKQRQYVAGRMRGLTKKESAIRAGYGHNAAEHPKDKIERSPVVRFALERWMHKMGISDRALGIEQMNMDEAERIRQALK